MVDGKKELLQKVVFCECYVMYISSQVYRAPGRNQDKKIFGIIILQDLKFSTPTLISEGLQSQFLI